eukprot:3941629-Rhodomonas_salina.3
MLASYALAVQCAVLTSVCVLGCVCKWRRERARNGSQEREEKQGGGEEREGERGNEAREEEEARTSVQRKRCVAKSNASNSAAGTMCTGIVGDCL